MGVIAGLLGRWFGSRDGGPSRETWEDVRARWAKENATRTGVVAPEDWPVNQTYGPPLGAGGSTIEVAELPPDLEDAIRQLRGWHHAGHGESCACRPCLMLRAKLAAAEVLGLVEHYPIAPYKK